MPEGHELLDDDERHLASLGYTQELNRSWSGFSNFAISFSIISILAGCFTSFGLGWNNGGPAAIAWGWPIISVFILIIGLCMSELVSAYPTSGGIYWWAAKLGGAKAGFYTGWLNLIGLIAILASVSYGCATFLDLTLGTFSETWLAGYSLTRTFILFLVILAMSATINIFSSHLLAVINNISVWWHVAGAAIVIAILWLLPEQHASFCDVFATTVNNTGFFGGETGHRLPASSSCRSRRSSRSTRSPATTRRPTSPRRPRARPTVRPRASGGRSSTPRSAAGSCC